MKRSSRYTGICRERGWNSRFGVGTFSNMRPTKDIWGPNWSTNTQRKTIINVLILAWNAIARPQIQIKHGKFIPSLGSWIWQIEA